MTHGQKILIWLGIVVFVLVVVGFAWWRWSAITGAGRMAVARKQPVPTNMPSATLTATPTRTQVPATAMPSATATRVVSPTSAPTGASSNITSTVNVTSTTFVSGTIGFGLTHPEFFEGQSTGKEYRASYDVGVKPNQVGLVFGFQAEWNGRVIGGPNGKCALVVLKPGWYPALAIADGRYEVYDLPLTNQEFWAMDLARIRNEEQNVHYGCSKKDQIPVWESNLPAIVWNVTVPSSPAPTATARTTISPTPTATTVKSGTPIAPTATPTAQQRTRVASGKDGKANFVKGDEVWGWEIVLGSGKKCTGGCYVPVAPESGTVKDGVVNPWPGEVPANVKGNPWKPS